MVCGWRHVGRFRGPLSHEDRSAGVADVMFRPAKNFILACDSSRSATSLVKQLQRNEIGSFGGVIALRVCCPGSDSGSQLSLSQATAEQNLDSGCCYLHKGLLPALV